VIAGLLLGAAGSALFLVLQKRTPDPESVNISWGGVACLVMVPLILLHSGSKAPTQSLLGQIATAVGPLALYAYRSPQAGLVIAICFTGEIKFSPVN